MASDITNMCVSPMSTVGLVLAISGIFGILAKIRALLVSIFTSQREVLKSAMCAVFERHDKAEEEILEHAAGRGEEIDTGVDFQKVLSELVDALPRPFRSRFQRGVKIGESDPNSVLKLALRNTLYQGILVSFQVASVLGFVVLALYYAAEI